MITMALIFLAVACVALGLLAIFWLLVACFAGR